MLRPHGVRGGLVVQAYAETIRSLEPDTAVLLGEARSPYRIASIRPHRGAYLVYLHGCSDRDTAESMRGAELQLRLQDVGPLPEHVYYHWQILGLQVVTEDGRQLGEVSEILETGANDVYVVTSPQGKELLLPALRTVVLQVDEPAGRLLVRLPPGLTEAG